MGNNPSLTECREERSRGQLQAHYDNTAAKEIFHSEAQGLMEQVVGRWNMIKAWEHVVSNGGAPGVDGMTVDNLLPWLNEHWSRTKVELLEDRYQPQAVRLKEIPKPGGKGVRRLGIPTVLDRLIQQALHQILSPLFDPDFSEHSYGFRPGRSAQQAVLQARAHAEEGRRWVVDMDLEKFFDQVNHDKLMLRLSRKISDKRVLRLIGRFLRAGMMSNGITSPRDKGTPQGGPLSPLLSNIVLDDLDKELEKRGHKFCRYADDCNIYVKSKRSGQRVLYSLTNFLAKHLKLKVNQSKSAVDRPWKRKFLGYSMTCERLPRLRISMENINRFRSSLKHAFHQGRGRNLKRFINEDLNPKLRGWINYFCYSDVKWIFPELDGWIRHHLRNILWRQWKRPWTRRRKLMQHGIPEEQAAKSAYNGRGPWWNAGATHMNRAFPKSYFDYLGLVSLVDQKMRFQCKM